MIEQILIGAGLAIAVVFGIKLWSRRTYLRKAWQAGKADPTGYLRGDYEKELKDE